MELGTLFIWLTDGPYSYSEPLYLLLPWASGQGSLQNSLSQLWSRFPDKEEEDAGASLGSLGQGIHESSLGLWV